LPEYIVRRRHSSSSSGGGNGGGGNGKGGGKGGGKGSGKGGAAGQGDDASPELWRNVLSVGPMHAGLAFHAHGAAWLATVRGSKLFMLFPPSAWPPSRSGIVLGQAADFAADVLASPPAGMRSCIVKANEAIVVPAGWYHATLNLEPTIAVGAQSRLGTGAGTVADPKDPMQYTTALQASVAGFAAYTQGDDAVAFPLLARATELEPLNFKFAANLISALLAGLRLDAAVTKANHAASLAVSLTSPGDAAYVLSYIAIKFFEAAIEHFRDPSNAERTIKELRASAGFFEKAAALATLDAAANTARASVAGLLAKVESHLQEKKNDEL